MLLMVVTLDVLKLSGWLNADAPCREPKGGHTMRGEVLRARRHRRWRETAAHRGRLNCRSGAGHGEERT